MTGRELQDRIELQWLRHTGAPTRYGAATWFGRACQRTRRAVNRWVNRGIVDGPHVTVLLLLEAMPAGSPWAREPESLWERLPEDFPHRSPLVKGGLDTIVKVWLATDEQMLELPGIGPAAVRKIRSWWGGGGSNHTTRGDE